MLFVIMQRLFFYNEITNIRTGPFSVVNGRQVKMKDYHLILGYGISREITF